MSGCLYARIQAHANVPTVVEAIKRTYGQYDGRLRKVLGASAASIGRLLSMDFLRPVLIAAGIACPLSWWAMQKCKGRPGYG